MKLFTSFLVGFPLVLLAVSINLPAADKNEKDQPPAKANQQRQGQRGQNQNGQGRQDQIGQGQGNQNQIGQGQGRQGQGGQNQVGQGQGRQGQGNQNQIGQGQGQGRQGQGNQNQVGQGQGNQNQIGQGQRKGGQNEPGQGQGRNGAGAANAGNNRGKEVVQQPIVKPPPPPLKEVKKSNGEVERVAPSGFVRERTKVDQKAGVKQTEHIAPTGRVAMKEVEDKNGTKQITHYDLGREKKAEVIRKDGSKEVTDVHYNRDGKERARETVKTDVSGKVVSKTVVKNVTINKTVIKTENHYVAGRYGFVYRPVVVVRPVLFVNPYWYTPAGVVIVHPYHYRWGFYEEPWYGYHAYYWEPYPVYQAPSYWVTDWMVAGYVADSYAISTSLAQTREEVRLAREDAEKAKLAAERAADAAEKAEAQAEQAAAEARAAKAEARAAKAELEESKRKELAGKPNPKATPIDKETKDALQNQIAKTIEEKKKATDDQVPPDVTAALADPEHIYPVSKKIACIRADDDEAAGFLTPGDLLKRKKGQDIPKEPGENMFVTMVVMTSKGDDDSVQAGTKIKISIKDLQEFDNEFRAKLDTGLVEAGKNQDAFKSGAI
jgi:hypothetical protein